MVIVQRLRRDAPWKWLKDGFADMMATPLLSLGYGLMFVLVGLAITVGLWWLDMLALAPVLVGGFALVAPSFAVGIYRISQVRESGETPRLLDFWRIPGMRIGQLALLSVLLLVFFMAWSRLAQFLYAGFSHGSYLPPSEFLTFVFNEPAGLTLLVVGTIIGAVLGFAAFTVSALSFPMLADQDVDAVTALVASVKTVIQQPFLMVTWAWLIAFFVAVGGAFFLIGLAVTFPWIAHASWRAYKDFDPKPDPRAMGWVET
ncbi:DUF2189 domain-containing protein [Maricaulaceae bacterium NA33B04]|nr:DUF2189 domain-containing protein [Maricaulaceae bacterium NA33B04]